MLSLNLRVTVVTACNFQGQFFRIGGINGNDIATFPDYPAEIRAPHNTIAGVSGYQVHVGKETRIIGDECDVLVAMKACSKQI